MDEEDKEDYEVLPTDNLLVVGRAEEDFSSIEIHGKGTPFHWTEILMYGCTIMGCMSVQCLEKKMTTRTVTMRYSSLHSLLL